MFVPVTFVTEHEQQTTNGQERGRRSAGTKAKALDLVAPAAVTNHDPTALKVALKRGLLLGAGDPIAFGPREELVVEIHEPAGPLRLATRIDEGRKRNGLD
jgi:hypothetical protein